MIYMRLKRYILRRLHSRESISQNCSPVPRTKISGMQRLRYYRGECLPYCDSEISLTRAGRNNWWAVHHRGSRISVAAWPICGCISEIPTFVAHGDWLDGSGWGAGLCGLYLSDGRHQVLRCTRSRLHCQAGRTFGCPSLQSRTLRHCTGLCIRTWNSRTHCLKKTATWKSVVLFNAVKIIIADLSKVLPRIEDALPCDNLGSMEKRTNAGADWDDDDSPIDCPYGDHAERTSSSRINLPMMHLRSVSIHQNL